FTSLTAPEVLRISKELRANRNDQQIAAIVEKCAPLIGKDVNQRFGAKIPCPLLEDNKCSVYTVRPIACRQCATCSAKDCEEAYHGKEIDLPYSYTHILAGNGVRLALHSALD